MNVGGCGRRRGSDADGRPGGWIVPVLLAIIAVLAAALVWSLRRDQLRPPEAPSAKAGAPAAQPDASPAAAAAQTPAAAAASARADKGDGAQRKVPPRSLLLHADAAGTVAELDGGGLASAVDFAPDGRWLFADKSRNRIVVVDRTGNEKSLTVKAPDDADFLAGGGYLVTSSRARSVVELDEGGKTVWRYTDLSKPMDADRLPNGNTLIADGRPGRVLEVDRAGNIVWSQSEGLLWPWDVERAPDDTVLVADYNRHQVRALRRDGSTSWVLYHVGHPSSLKLLDDGGFLVSTHKAGSVVRADSKGRILGNWRIGPDLEDFALAESGEALFALLSKPESELPVAVRDAAAGELLENVRRAPPAGVAARGVTVASEVQTSGKNLIVILFDSLRRDHVPWHGYWRDTAPHLDELSRRALIFDQYITQAPWTKPSVASLLTSTYASTHGVVSQKPQSQLPASLTTIAEVLSSAGYYTAAVMQNPHMGDRRSSKGFEQGYQKYDYLGDKKLDGKLPGLMGDTAIETLRKRPEDRPFFLTMFFMNPHYPYEPHHLVFGDKKDGPSNPGPINSYDAEIFEADAAVGRLLAFLEENGLDDDTIVLFSSDHGEELGDHRNRFHGDTLYDCVLNVPLLVAGLDRNGRFPGLVREVDVMPTLLDFLGVVPGPDLRAQMVGVSVRPLLQPGIVRTGLVAYSQSQFRDNVHLVSERSESRKVIADLLANEVKIFDLMRDPQEINNLSTPETTRLELTRLSRWETGFETAEADAGPTEAVPEEVLERLRAAGYLGGQ